MKSVLTLVILSFITFRVALCQSFIMTDYKTSGCIYDSKEQSRKNEVQTLGSSLDIAVYDSKLKLTITKGEEPESIILNKQREGVYQLAEKGTYGGFTILLTLDTILGYTRAITLIETSFIGPKQKCIHSVTAKRR